MFHRSLKTVFVVLLVFVISSAASALPPEDALSARPAESVYTVMRIDDLNGLLQYVFSPANVEMMTSLANQEQAQIVGLVAAFAAQIPAKSVVIASGMAENGPFVQAVVSMPSSVRPKLDKVADGSATNIDIVTLLLGDAGMMFAEGFASEVRQGAKGPYYSLQDQVIFTAKEDLLLVASSQNELEASIDALEKKETRLSQGRRFDSPNYWQMHMDMNTTAALAEMAGGDALGVSGELTRLFKAPLKIEFAFSPKPGSFLLSAAINILESLADSARYKDSKPVKGGSLFLAGGGKLLFALSSPLAFRASDFKTHPEAAAGGEQFIQGLAAINISESDVEDLLNGSFSIALGSDATFMGTSVPGGYFALTGRKGTAAKVLGKLMESELSQAVSLAPLKVNGWDSAFSVDPAVSPVPLVFGVKQDTLFVGCLNSDALGKTPELSAEIAKMLDTPLFGLGVIDAAAIWNRLRQEAADPNSLLSATMQDPVKGIVSEILGADLSVPLIKIWSPELETVFMEFSITDVPQEKRLLPRLVKIGQTFAQ